VNLSSSQRWILFLTVLFIVAAWPPERGRSALMKGVNWIVDPTGSLPILPPQLGFGLSDDLRAVEERDALVHQYDTAYNSGALMRRRLELKVATDPFEPASERQLLLILGVVVAFLVLRR
jgi:hypothetical protein